MRISERLEQDKDLIIEAYLAGESTCSIGRRYGCGNGLVYVALRDKWNVPIRETKVFHKHEADVVKLFNEGLSCYEIDRKLNISHSMSYRILKRLGYDTSEKSKWRSDPLKNHKEEIISLYEQGYSSTEIAVVFDTYTQSICEKLNRWEVEIRPNRTYQMNEEFFSCIDNELNAYCLGLFMADSCNMPQNWVVNLSLTDRDLLDDVVKIIKFDGPVRTIIPENEDYKPLHFVNFCSKRMSLDLTALGCVRQKTYRAEIPIIEESLIRHMLRGWTDGDGGIYKDKKKNSWFTSITGTKAVCFGITELVYRLFGFEGYKRIGNINPDNGHETWVWRLDGNRQVKTYLDWLYDDATIFLDRKRKVYEQLCLYRCNLDRSFLLN